MTRHESTAVVYPFLDHQRHLCYPINTYAFIRVEGEDAATFLQGQLSGDIRQVNPYQSGLGAYHTLKGRVFASFRILQLAPNEYLLCTHSSTVDDALQHLKKYAVFSKITLATAPMWVIGVQGANIHSLPRNLADIPTHILEQMTTTDGGWLIKTGHESQIAPASYEIFFNNESATLSFSKALQDSGFDYAPTTQHALTNHQHGMIFVCKQTQALFLPQSLAYNRTPMLSFKKGCYHGQEVVVRLEHRGQLKHRLHRFQWPLTQQPSVGDPLFLPHQKVAVGHIVGAVSLSDSTVDVCCVLSVAIDQDEPYLLTKSKERCPLTETLPMSILLD